MENNNTTKPTRTRKTTSASSAKTKAEVKTEEKVKKFKATEGVVCRSITVGELGMVGIKSGINYRWEDYGYDIEVEYQDLVAAMREGERNTFINKPYFVIQDKDFINEYKKLNGIYKNIFSVSDLKDILKQEPSVMKATIESLPDGAKESIKNIAATQVQNGMLDSVKKIKIIDEIFGTEYGIAASLYY